MQHIVDEQLLLVFGYMATIKKEEEEDTSCRIMEKTKKGEYAHGTYSKETNLPWKERKLEEDSVPQR